MRCNWKNRNSYAKLALSLMLVAGLCVIAGNYSLGSDDEALAELYTQEEHFNELIEIENLISIKEVKDGISAFKWIMAKVKFWMFSFEYRFPIDGNLSLQERSQKYGFNFKSHEVVTKDFYHLTVFQVSKPNLRKDAPVVLIQHGLFEDASWWFKNGAKSPVFLLAKYGFNVFCGNNRGNRFSRRNDRMTPKSDPKHFFDYSFYELGKYDAPAQIDYIR